MAVKAALASMRTRELWVVRGDMVFGLVLLTDAFFKDRAGLTTPAFSRDFRPATRRREPRFAPRHVNRNQRCGQTTQALRALPARAMTAAEVVSSNQTSPLGVTSWSMAGTRTTKCS